MNAAAVSLATIAACSTAQGGHSAVLRLSGSEAVIIARRAGLKWGPAWTVLAQEWSLAGLPACPCRVLFCPAPHSFTGCDVVEVIIPGAPDLVELALSALIQAGAEPATPGAFTRQALANGRLRLDQAEAVLALTQAAGIEAARQALARLTGVLSEQLGAVRDRLLVLRAQVEAGLDFLEEEDARAYEPTTLRNELHQLRSVVASFRVAADQWEAKPCICLVGAANAGKSALFNRLTGASALVSPVAGTTRDWLDAPWIVAGRALRLVDTAGWNISNTGLDLAAFQAGQATVTGATLILACSAPDAPLPEKTSLPEERTLVIATKADLGLADARAALAVSVETGAGLEQLTHLVAERLNSSATGEPRQQRLLAACEVLLGQLCAGLPADELLADDLRRVADLLGELIGLTTPEEVLNAIFSRFCIGK